MVGQTIKEARKKLKLSQSALSDKCGIARPLIARYETGVTIPTGESLEKIAHALEIPYTVLSQKNNSDPKSQRKSTISPVKVIYSHLKSFDEQEIQLVKQVVDFILSKKEKESAMKADLKQKETLFQNSVREKARMISKQLAKL